MVLLLAQSSCRRFTSTSTFERSLTSAFHNNGDRGTECVKHTGPKYCPSPTNSKTTGTKASTSRGVRVQPLCKRRDRPGCQRSAHGSSSSVAVDHIKTRNLDVHQNLTRGIAAYCNLAANRQRHPHDIVREQRAIPDALPNALNKVFPYTAGGWDWTYHTAATIRQDAAKDTNGGVLKYKLTLNWTAAYKILAVDPCPTDALPDDRPLVDKLLYLNLPPDVPGPNAKRRLSVLRCKPFLNPHDMFDMPRYLSAGLPWFVLSKQ